jgi:hypothetical protein
MWARLGWDGCTCSARRASRALRIVTGRAVHVNEYEISQVSTRKLTAMDMRQIAHSEVCVDALSPSFFVLVRLRRRWCVCLLEKVSFT